MHKLFQKHTHKVTFYQSADDFTQALLVMLVTNFTSAEVPPVCPSNSTTLFSYCPPGLTTPIRRREWFGRSRNTCEDKFGQLVGIESTEGNCLSCLSCEGEAAERKRALKEQMERELREIEARVLARARNKTLAGE